MKHLLLIGAVILLFLLSACSKSNNSSASQGYWVINGDRYAINYTARINSNGYSVLSGKETQDSASQVNSIYIWFKAFPSQNGSYQMIPFDSTAAPLSAGQIWITGLVVNAPPINLCSANYWFDASGFASMNTWPWPLSDSAQVTVSNGKIKVVIPQTIAGYANSCGIDSVALTGYSRSVDQTKRLPLLQRQPPLSFRQAFIES